MIFTNREHMIYFGLGLVAVIILCIFVLPRIFGFGSENTMVQEAGGRVREAFNSINVSYPSGTGGSTSQNLDTFLASTEDSFSSISVPLDFSESLKNLERDDFAQATAIAEESIKDMQDKLGKLFTKTDVVSVEAKNSTILNEENYDLPTELTERESFDIDVNFFLDTRDKLLKVDTEYGTLDIHSNFFYGKEGLVVADLEREQGTKLRFSLETDDATNEHTLHLLLLDSTDNPKVVENPGKSTQITIPLTSELLHDGEGDLLYDAVEYIGEDNKGRGILPRSFVDDENLYIFINRTGSFKLISTGNSKPNNKTDFLAIRNINIPDGNADGLVTRADFVRALMNIHWVEDLNFRDEDVVPFPDIPIQDFDLSKKINVGKKLGVWMGYPAAPGQNSPFKPDDSLMRRDMFVLLSNYIEAFGIDAEGVLPFDSEVVDSPIDSDYWLNSVRNLESIGFIPYRDKEGVKFIEGNEPITVEECQDILYKLITTRYGRL